MDDYGIYSVDGKKLLNSTEILQDKSRFWGNLTKKVFDNTPNNGFGILLHPLWINGTLYWIIRESKKCHIDVAKWWCKKLFRNGYK